MKVLVVSQYFPPETAAGGIRAAELATNWAAAGHDVTVLTGFPNYPDGVIAEPYRRRSRCLIYRETLRGVSIWRTWLFARANSSALGRALNYGTFMLSAGLTGSCLARPDVVIGTSPPPTVALAGWYLSRAMRVPFVFDVRDLWPESIAAVGMSSADSALARGIGAVVRRLYNSAEHITVVSPPFREVLIRDWEVSPDKISIVENGVDLDLFRPLHCEDIRSELGLEGKFVVCYAGTIGLAHGLKTVIEAALQLRKKAPEVVFLLAGGGAETTQLIEKCHAVRAENIVFLGIQPRTRIPALLQTADACLVLLKNNELFRTVIPTKLLEAMACSRPVILGVDGYARQIMEKGEAGIFIEPENASQLVDAVLMLRCDRNAGRKMGANGRTYIERNFSRAKLAQQYLRVLQSLPQSSC